MRTEFNVGNQKVELSCRLAPRHLFLATDTRVLIDGVQVAASGGFSFSESAVGTFRDGDGKQRQVEVQFNSNLLSMGADYIARVDGVVVSQGRVVPDNIAIGCAAYVTLGFLFIGAAAAVAAILVAAGKR